MWRPIRIALLLLVLVVVASQAMFDRHRARDWTGTQWIGLHPLNGDGSAVAEQFIANIRPENYVALEQFFAREGARHGLANDRLVHVELYPRPARPPPPLARDPGWLQVVVWSLRMRWYAWRAPNAPGQPSPAVRLFVLFHDPQRSPSLPHSVGLGGGRMGVVHAFASREQHGSNLFVIAHELLHTAGAADLYEPATNQPLFPDGYAEPDLRPLLPQRKAEIMAGRIPVTDSSSEIPRSLDEVVVGPITARDIGWTSR